MTIVHRFDVATLGNATRTPQGFLRIPAYLTRIGVLEYRRADGTVVRELRPRDEVFAAHSLATLSAAPVTDLHPTRMVGPDNVRELQIGHVSDHVQAAGDFVAAHVTIQEAKAIAAVEAGDRRELSCGYACRIDATPGVFEGQPYDQTQRDITYNHVAIGPRNWGRAGRDTALRVDSADGADADVDVFRLDSADALSVSTIGAPEDDDVEDDDVEDDDAPDEADSDDEEGKLEELLARSDELRGRVDGALLEADPAKYLRDETERTELVASKDLLQARVDGLSADVADMRREIEQAREARRRDAPVNQTELIAERDALAARVDGLTEDLCASRTALEQAQAQSTATQQREFLAAVHERADLLSRARRVLPADHVFDGQTARQIHEAVLAAIDPAFDAAGRADPYVCCRFDSAIESYGRSNLDEARRITTPRFVPRAERADARERFVPDWQKPLSFTKAKP